MILGIRKLLDIIYSQQAVASSTANTSNSEGPESFVLHHPDLDFQNIICNEDGIVSAIIDWEVCVAVPRCAGFTCLPDFLRRDWSEDHELSEMPHMDWPIDRYIQIYAEAMHDAGVADAIYKRKSAMYRAVVGAVNGGSPVDLFQKLFACISGVQRVDVERFEQLVGKGCSAAEEFIKAEIGKLLAPEVLTRR
ncbi:hypothetical protein N0V95_004902 [Ascochyta clinopodiicola]|nr:hypothetical protein N0V95_004902 [Ascochyta clinopodiicola]